MKGAAGWAPVSNRLRHLLETREFAVAVFVTLADPGIVEIAALAGFDLVVVELEHAGLGLESLQNHLRAAAARGIGTLVRVPSHDPKLMLRVLDCGADGILVPHVEDRAQARALVDAVRYPPAGHRGLSGTARSAHYGAHGMGSVRELTEQLNVGTVLAVMIEDQKGAEAIDEILSVGGLDIVHVGPSDLSASMNLIGSRDDPRLVAAIDKVMKACHRVGVKLGMPVGHGAYPRSAQSLRGGGAWLLTCGADASYLLAGFKAAAEEANA
ncbi:MAG: hypothetical protein J2P57_17365 [Acidimicrobiaceae bacterium]|nr:hypothetical protein [Acidimicrobiaceae bacterium]